MGGGEEAEPLPDTHGTLAVLSRRTGPAQGISRLAGVRRRMTRKKGGGGVVPHHFRQNRCAPPPSSAFLLTYPQIRGREIIQRTAPIFYNIQYLRLQNNSPQLSLSKPFSRLPPS